MKCQRCGETHATVRFTEVVGAHKSERQFCAGCAKDEGLFVQVDLGSASAALEGALGPARRSRASAPELLLCPDCDCTLEQIRRTARVGCPTCYEVFAEALAPILEQTHGCREHVRRARGPEGDDA